MNRSVVGRFLDTFFSLPVLFALLAMLAVQHFFSGGVKKEVFRPVLNREIHFSDHKVSRDNEVVFVETDLCEYSFSTVGAVLIGSTFKKYVDRDNVGLRTVHERGQFERDQAVFLLALEDKTPLDYALIGQKDIDGGTEISFAAETVSKDWKIEKTFRLYNDSYRIDIILAFTPLKHLVEPLIPRLFVQGPFLGEVEKDTLDGVVLPLGEGKVERISAVGDELERWWDAPSIVGVEDKYFLHALIGYEPGFLKHVFYKRTATAPVVAGSALKKTSVKRAASGAGLSVVLECVPVTEQSEVSLNWYFGPKSLLAMEKVDARLTSFLSLGWFTWLGKWLLGMVETLYSYLGNYGWAIIALSLLIRVPLIPLCLFFKRKAAKYENVTRLYAHDLAVINARHKDDAVARQDEVSRFYESHGASSAGAFYALLPQLIMLPVFVSLLGLLSNALALFNAPFIGWIVNLGASDPYYIFPIFIAAAMAIKQYYAPKIGREMHFMKIVGPIIMLAVMMRFPVGILLYSVTIAIVDVLEDFVRSKIWSA